MRLFFTILVAITVCIPLAAQRQNYYQRSVAAYRALKADSALWYIDQAIEEFSRLHKTDSLVFSYEHKADIIWREKGIAQGLAVIDMALKLAVDLPPAHLAHIAALNKKGQIQVHNGEAAKGKKLLLEALALVPAHASPHEVYANLYTNLSWLFLELQDFTPALTYANEAKRMAETLHGKDARQLVGVYQTLCLIAHDAGLLDQAEKYGLELYRLATLNLPPTHPNLGLMHNDVGTVYESMQRFEQALFHRQRMVDITQQNYLKNKNPQLLAIAYNNMGNLYETVGEFYLSHEYFEKALRLHEINYGANSPGIVRPLTHLANAKRAIGKYEEAGALYEKAYQLQQTIEPGDWLNLAYVETQYGDLFYAQERYDRSETLYLRALNNYKKARIDHTSIVESTRTTLGEVYARTKRSNEALALLHQANKAYRTMHPAGHIVIAGQLNKISETWLLANNITEARNYSDSIFAELLQVKQIQKGKWLMQLPYNFHIIRYLKNRVNILHEQYKNSGKIIFLEEALQLTDDYQLYLERGLPAFRTQTSVIDLASQNKSFYNIAIEACWELYEKENNAAYIEKAFGLTERSKALLLRLAANNLMVDVNRNAKDPVAEKDQYWRSRISELNALYLNEESKNDSLLTALSRTMEAYRLFQDSLVKQKNPEAMMKYRLQPYSLHEIRQKLLSNDQTMLQYAVTDNYVFVFVLSNLKFRAVRLPRSVLADVKPLQQLYGLTPAAFSGHAHRLYKQLIAPVKNDIESRRLLIIPDADLYYLNFEILLQSQGSGGFDKMDYLIRHYNISYLLSAASAIQFKSVAGNTSTKALLMAPVFTDEMKAAYHNGMPDTTLADRNYLSLLRQPFALQAAHEIGRYVENNLLWGQQARESAFKGAVGDYRILHLGTHAEINNQSPLQSRFFLAKPLASDSGATDDGYLHAYEIYAMQLKAELAVLSACETGAGTWKQGEGVISLTHSFMHAGCRSVVMSLWKIDEKTSAGILAKFYKYLSKAYSKSEALRYAKLDYLNHADHELAHPYYWAGLNLMGDDAVVYPKSYWWIWVLLAVMLIGTVMMWKRLAVRRSVRRRIFSRPTTG